MLKKPEQPCHDIARDDMLSASRDDMLSACDFKYFLSQLSQLSCFQAVRIMSDLESKLRGKLSEELSDEVETQTKKLLSRVLNVNAEWQSVSHLIRTRFASRLVLMQTYTKLLDRS